MISVLICSINPDYRRQITNSIQVSIGVPYEIHFFDNRIEQKGLCEVYNILAAKAKYDYLCFMHEDLLICTDNWGETVLSTFEDPAIALIGVAGNKYKSAFYSGWFNGNKQLDCVNILHRYAHGDERLFLKPEQNNLNEEVVCVDGVLMCCRRKVWSDLRFDEQNIKGFHFYDIDFSLRVSEKYKVLVTYQIDLIHITKGGDFGDNWVKEAFSFHALWQDRLPFSKGIRLPEMAEKKIAKQVLDQLKTFKISAANKWKWVKKQRLYRDPYFYYPILKFAFYEPFGLKKLHKLFKQK